MLNKSKIVLFLILFIGLFLRLYGNNWDQGWHLHPDERFLTMVGAAVKIPSALDQYLNQYKSSFNPVNKGHAFYVYGTFPILLNKAVAQYLYNDTYELFNLQGRMLSAIADFLIIIIVYKLIELVENKLKFNRSIKYCAAFFYAIAVLPIQLSHFYTVDTFLSFFCWLSLYFAVKLVVDSQKSDMLHTTCSICLSALFLGLAFACKVSALYFAPLIGLFIFFSIIMSLTNASLDPSAHRLRMTKGKMCHSERSEESSECNERKISVLFVFIGVSCFILFCYLALRLGSPYYFETNNIFNPQLSKIFINNIQTLKSFDNPQALFPPAIQWLSKSYDFSIKNIVFFGVGPFYFLLSLGGVFLLLKKKNIYITLCILWSVLFLTYQSVQFAKTMRYLIFLYPFLAIFAAVGLSYVFTILKKLHDVTRYTLYVICYALVLVWPLAFMSIYTKDHSRVAASKWIYENITQNSKITYEYWDDPLPLMVQDPTTRNYQGITIHIFDPDTKEKWDIINNQLSEADYYIMSSNRGWGSIVQVPDRYPIASQFYKDMLAAKENFTLVKEFSSYPTLRYLGIPLDFPDQWSEEAFTVYDHPLVYIFKKNK